MKRLIIAGVLLLSAFGARAQDPVYLFSEYEDAHFTFIDSRTADARTNFDMLRQKIYYRQGADIMEMTGMERLATLTVGGRRFVMTGGMLCEVIPLESGQEVLVNWRIRKINRGYKGPFGNTLQRVEEVWVNPDLKEARPEAETVEGKDEYIVEVWNSKSENTYFILVDGQQYRIRRPNDLYKAFPAQAQQLKAFAKADKNKMLTAEEALRFFAEFFRLRGE
jgi:hypothetical protein